MSDRRLFEFNNTSGKRYHFYIHNAIDWDSELFEQMTTMREASADDEVHIHINGHGGSVDIGTQYIAAMQASKAKIITYNEGLAASMFGLIFLAGQYAVPLPFSCIMIHQVQVGVSSIAASELEEYVKHSRSRFKALYKSIAPKFTTKKEDDKIFNTAYDMYLDYDEQIRRLGSRAVAPEEIEEGYEPYIVDVSVARELTDSPEMAEVTRLAGLINAEIISRVSCRLHGAVFIVQPTQHPDVASIIREMLEVAEMTDISVTTVNNYISILFKIPE